MDDESVAFRIQLEEIRLQYDREEREAQTQIGRDIEQAIPTFREEVTATLETFDTGKDAQRIARTLDADARALTATATGMTLAEADRRRITPNRDPQSESPSMISQIPGYNLLCRQLGRLNLLTGILHDASTDTDDVAELSTKTVKGELCVVCYDEFTPKNMKDLSCEHRYCNGCLKTLFKVATDGEDFVQPQCCGTPIPLALIERELTSSEIKQFKSAEVEFLSVDKIYCSDTSCDSFIASPYIKGDQATCPKCDHNTCIKCKNEYHVKEDCPADPALHAVLTLARDRGWQRCYACKTMVELGEGCYHITCKCRAQFCYKCGEKWGTCLCNRYSDDREHAARLDGRLRNHGRFW